MNNQRPASPTYAKKTLRCSSGVTMVEYSLLAVLLSVVAIAGALKLGDESRKTTQNAGCVICMTQRLPSYSNRAQYCRLVANLPASQRYFCRDF